MKRIRISDCFCFKLQCFSESEQAMLIKALWTLGTRMESQRLAIMMVYTLRKWQQMHWEEKHITSYLGRLVVQDNQVAVAYIETWEMVTGILGIKYILVNNKCCTSRFRCMATGNTKKKKRQLCLPVSWFRQWVIISNGKRTTCVAHFIMVIGLSGVQFGL